MRFVRSEQELVEVIVESLERLQQKLHGETPSVRDVWDRQARTRRWRPIDENGLCDYVARHLREDLERCGIVALREVQIRRGCGDGRGERTDIYLKDSGCEHGLYLVGWFNCDAWDKDDNRWRRAPRWTVEEAREFFSCQAEECSDEETSLHAVVLDMAFR